MKRLISLISTHGKPSGQAAKESWKAYLKFRKVEAEVLAQSKKARFPQNPKHLYTSNKHEQVEAEITFLPSWGKKKPTK